MEEADSREEEEEEEEQATWVVRALLFSIRLFKTKYSGVTLSSGSLSCKEEEEMAVILLI